MPAEGQTPPLNPHSSSTPPDGWPEPRAAYVHVPFCRHRCGYCNFSVIAGRDDLVDRFQQAIDRELAALDCPSVDTVFVGGGTPTNLSEPQLDRFLAMIRRRFDFSRGAEWTMEANPEDVTRAKLELLRTHGVNRVSLGVQSFDNRKLRSLERAHGGESAKRVVRTTAEVIPNVSIDLIFGAPGETLAVWTNDLEIALSLPIRHLSTYALTYEKGTSFWSRLRRGQLESVDETIELDMYQAARSYAQSAGLMQYEVSNFAVSGSVCRHNLAYWAGNSWFAAGPGAARFVEGRREVNHRSTTTYLKRIEANATPTAESETITVEQYAREMAAFGIRTIDGINLDQIQSLTGVNLASLCEESIARCLDEGLFNCSGQFLSLSARGILFADTVASRFLL